MCYAHYSERLVQYNVCKICSTRMYIRSSFNAILGYPTGMYFYDNTVRGHLEMFKEDDAYKVIRNLHNQISGSFRSRVRHIFSNL